MLGPLRALERAPGPQSGFAWSWLGAALQATGLAVRRGQRARAALPPGDRRPGRGHPEPSCSPGGSGWPWAAARPPTSTSPATAGRPRTSARPAWRECVEVIRALLAGETVSHRRPGHRRPGPAVVAARDAAAADRARRSAPETAAWVGGWADGLVTVNQPHDRLRAVIDAFREGGGEGKPLYLQVHLSWAADEETALADRPRPVAQQRVRPGRWPGSSSPAGAVRRAARHVPPEDVRCGGARLGRPGPPHRLAGRATPSSASTASTCTRSARRAPARRSSTSSGQGACPELAGRGGPA